MSDPLPRGNTETQRAASAAGDRAGADMVAAAREGFSTISDGISNAWNAVTGNETPAAGATGAAAADAGNTNEDTDPNTPGVQRRSSFRWGNMVGGLLGVGGAWLASSVFGGGWLGTVMFALFAVPAFMMGRSQLGGWLSGMFGEKPSPAAGQSPERAQGPTQSTAQAVGAAPATTLELTPQQRLQQDVADVAQKSTIAGATISQLVQTGDMNPRQANTAMRSIREYQQMVAGMQRLDIGQLSADQLQDIQRRFTSAESNLDRLIGRNPIIAAQLQQQVIPTPAAVSPIDFSQPANVSAAQWYQPAGVVPMGRPVTTIGSVLDPQAQAQINALRTQGYDYAPATEAPTAGPRFAGAQYLTNQRVN